MILYTRKILHRYEWIELPIDNNVTEQPNQLCSDEKTLVKDKYKMFESAADILMFDKTHEEAPDMIDKD